MGKLHVVEARNSCQLLPPSQVQWTAAWRAGRSQRAGRDRRCQHPLWGDGQTERHRVMGDPMDRTSRNG